MIYDRQVAREAQNHPSTEPNLVLADLHVVECDSEDILQQVCRGVSEDILRRERMNYTAYQGEDLAPGALGEQGLDAAFSPRIM